MDMPGKEAEFSSYYENIGQHLHDLAQPLSAVTGLIDLLLMEMDEHDKLFQEVQMVSWQLERATEIIKEIRQLAREAAEYEKRTIKPPLAPMF
jgi:signal transduction histidine kinase